MSKITDKAKEKMKDAKDKVVGAKDDTQKETRYDSTKEYEASEPVSSAKTKEHEPTAVRKEMKEKTTEGDRRATNPEEAKETASKDLVKEVLKPITKVESKEDKELQEQEVESTGGGMGAGGG